MAQTSTAVRVDVSTFDVEANETGDLVLVKGGAEQYPKMAESQMQASLAERQPTITVATSAAAVSASSPPPKPIPLPQSSQVPSSMVRACPPETLSPPPEPIVQDEEPVSEESSVPLSDPPSYEQAVPLQYRVSIVTYDSEIRSIYGDQHQIPIAKPSSHTNSASRNGPCFS